MSCIALDWCKTYEDCVRLWEDDPEQFGTVIVVHDLLMKMAGVRDPSVFDGKPVHGELQLKLKDGRRIPLRRFANIYQAVCVEFMSTFTDSKAPIPIEERVQSIKDRLRLLRFVEEN